ncbi:MAG: ABC transporter permease [Defluviitaleaceae bacterium]|nr:ABC transporter permease [Defluviitaleaceae bacterium]
MIIRPKDTAKLFGIFIMCFCAVLICTIFLNSNIDMARIKDQITDPEAIFIYDLTVSSGNVTSAVSGGALVLTTVVMLLFYIKHYIDTHKSELGILKALGYPNRKIARSFWVFGLPVLTGTAFGFGGAFALMPAFYRTMRNDGVLPDTPLHFNPILILYLVVIPALAFSVLAVLYSYLKLKRTALELIRGSNKTKPLKTKPLKTKPNGTQITKIPFLRELKRSTVKSRFSLVFFIWFAAFCYAASVVMSFSITVLGGSDMMAVLMMFIGVLLAVTTLFLAVTTVIKGNTKTIAMLRVFGYSDRECTGAMLSGYRPITYAGFAIGSAYQHGLMRMMMSLFYDNEILGLPDYSFDWQVCFIVFVSFVALYEIFMWIYSEKIKRIPLKEVMMEE